MYYNNNCTISIIKSKYTRFIYKEFNKKKEQLQLYAWGKNWKVWSKTYSNGSIISTKLINIPYAYPVIEKGIELKLDKVFEYLKTFKNLNILGRSAQFQYIHTHDLFDSAEKTIKNLLNKGKING